MNGAGSADQPLPEVESFFLPPEEVDDMRKLVEKKRGKTSVRKDDDDAILTGLSMPNHVYDGCTSRFIAANESNAKAEKSVFSDTGLMALICCHERILFLVNLRDAGEKQYNALALMNRFFKEVPEWWRLGFLYDIGCQLHHSMVKVSVEMFRVMWEAFEDESMIIL